MTNVRRLAFRISLAVSVAGGLAAAIALGVAFTSLSGGPNMTGYGILAAAMESLPYLAAVIVITVIIAPLGRRIRIAVGGLALASGAIGGIAAGLVSLGSTLARIEPRDQPADLNSLLLAVWGVGTQVVPIAVVLAAGALVLLVGTWIARRLTIVRTAVPAVTVS